MINSSVAITAAGADNGVALDLGADLEGDLAANLHNVTASAIRILLSITFQATAVVGDAAIGSYGIMWVPQEAFNTGAAQLPSPDTDSADWMAHGAYHVVADVAAVISMPRFGHNFIKNDSMRKQRENHSVLALIIMATTLNDPISIGVHGRTLFLLP